MITMKKHNIYMQAIQVVSLGGAKIPDRLEREREGFTIEMVVTLDHSELDRQNPLQSALLILDTHQLSQLKSLLNTVDLPDIPDSELSGVQ